MRRSGPRGEDTAARFLEERGFRIVARNWRAGKAGEIDIVARDGGALVIVEVKTATGVGFGEPLSWVTPRKLRQLAALAELFVSQTTETFECVRFDVVAIRAGKGRPQITHLRDAFRP